MNVISYTLFRAYGRPLDPMYTIGALANARIAARLYPEWRCRFYIGKHVPDSVTAQLWNMDNVDVVDMAGAPEDWSALMWRFATMLDGDVERHMFRDTDSRPDEREAAAVAEWIGSGYEFHIMRDHPEHSVPMCAGMWGCTRAGAARVVDSLPRAEVVDNFTDQTWLAKYVYPVALKSVLVHDSTDKVWPGETPRRFSVKREALPYEQGWRFVGQAFTAAGLPRIPADAKRVAA